MEEFEQTLVVMRRFVEATNQHVPFLLRKAERVEEYLQQRETNAPRFSALPANSNRAELPAR